MLSGEVRGNFINAGEDIDIHPFARLTWQDTRIEAYAESGALGLDRAVDQVNINPINAELGMDVRREFKDFYVGAQASWIEGIESDAQTYATVLVTIPNVPVSITTDGSDNSYGRLSGIAGYNLSDNLDVAILGSTQVNRTDSEGLNAVVRVNCLVILRELAYEPLTFLPAKYQDFSC